MPLQNNFGVVDYVVFIGALVGSMAIGAFFAISDRKKTNTEEYFVGGRHMKLLPVSCSMVVSFISAVLIIGMPAEFYLYGGTPVLALLGGLPGAFLCAFFVVPMLYNLQLTSINEYFEKRFHSSAPKYIGSIANIVFTIVYTGIVLFAPAITISAVTGMPSWSVILISWLVTLIYTTIGGMKAVVWTDFFQTFVMIAGMLATVIQGMRLVGGLGRAFELARDNGRLDLWDFDFDLTKRFTFWSVVVTAILDYMFMRGATQASMQRYCALPSLRQAQMSIFISLIGSGIFFVAGLASGLAIFAYYAEKRCDPLAAGFIENPNQLVPFFVMETLSYPGVAGLFVAALCTGSLSSASSVLNSAAANTWEDFLKPRLLNTSDERAVTISKVLVVIYGTLSLGVCVVVGNLGGTIAQVSMSFTSSTIVPTTGMVALGCLVPWANWKGATAAAAVCFLFLFWIAMGSYSVQKHITDMLPSIGVLGCQNFLNDTQFNVTDYHHYNYTATTSIEDYANTTVTAEMESSFFLDPLYGISFQWYGNIGLIIVLVVGSLVSLCTGYTKSSELEPNLIFPCIGRVLYSKESQKDYRKPTVDYVTAIQHTGDQKKYPDARSALMTEEERITNL